METDDEDFDLTNEERIKFIKIFIKVNEGRIKDMEDVISDLRATLGKLEKKENVIDPTAKAGGL